MQGTNFQLITEKKIERYKSKKAIPKKGKLFIGLTTKP